ncbi:MAG: hypothetical protein K0R83_479 [Caulobacter sp.]|nr:hypothetical protein [Caulobacter sp.]
MTASGFHMEQTVAEALKRWPATLAAFVSRGMACPGCDMAGHMSLREAADAYRLDSVAFEADLRRLVDAD